MLAVVLLVAACGGGGSGRPDEGGTTPPSPPPSGTPAPLELRSLELAQTHVIGAEGRQMQSANDRAANRSRRLDL
ncbi:MAG TPA: hypothetical protein DDZ67_05905, partial [Xanthomonadaceae bacterium]|nr:hypothetical protein [Xanthomonadaceae bacterium]